MASDPTPRRYRNRVVFGLLAALAAGSGSTVGAADAVAAKPALVLLIVVDGLRPDTIRADTMPNLYALGQQGVRYTHTHSVFPTLTRVNAASLGSGALPDRTGIVANGMYVEGVNATKPFNTADYLSLLKLATVNRGRVVGAVTLSERLKEHGVSFVAITSGSTGQALLLNPTAPSGTQVLIDPGFEDGKRVAFPDSINEPLLKAYGTVESEDSMAPIDWTQRVLREYVLPTLKPQVVVTWMSEPDDAQHEHGVGSPQALAAMKKIDDHIGRLQARLRELGLADRTDILVTSDHGFAAEPNGVDLDADLKAAGVTQEDVVVARNDEPTFLYVKHHSPERIQKIVQQLQNDPNIDVLFTSGMKPEDGKVSCSYGATHGWVEGTFALELAHQCTEHAADIIVTYRWTRDKNEFGFSGIQWVPSKGGAPLEPGSSGHGGLNPYVVHSTLILSGPDFARHAVIDVPSGNQDLAPTIMALVGVPLPNTVQGRVLTEAMARSAQPAPKTRTQTLQARHGAYCAELIVSTANDRTYLDEGHRCASH